MKSAAALLGFLAVALGAFGAHALDGVLTAEAEAWWDTATLYALTHAAASLAIALSPDPRRLRFAGWSIVLGASLFAATLYAMALGAPRWLGAVTPVGGLGMLAGWAALFVDGLRRPTP